MTQPGGLLGEQGGVEGGVAAESFYCSVGGETGGGCRETSDANIGRTARWFATMMSRANIANTTATTSRTPVVGMRTGSRTA
jgi:hypothetical protein